MSYEKAMKHWRNPRKGKPQYMGFESCSGKSVRSNPYMCAIISIQDWWKSRHEGNSAYNRECIREQVAEARLYSPKSAGTAK